MQVQFPPFLPGMKWAEAGLLGAWQDHSMWMAVVTGFQEPHLV